MAAALRRLGDLALTVGALLGLVALLAAASGAVLGVRPLFFRSGSMAPTIQTGSLALARSVPARELRPGDVVSVLTGSGTRVTHRVVSVDPAAGQVLLTLKGDANELPDPEVYPVGSAYRVFWHVPWVGYAAGALLTPVGVFALGLGVMGLLLLVMRRGGTAPPRSGGRRRAGPAPSRHRGRRAAATAAATAAVLAGPAGPASAAPWTDPVAIGGTTLTAATVPAPATFTCSPAIGSTNFTWAAVSGATDYTFHYDSGGSFTRIVAGTATSVSGLINGGTAWVEANRAFGSVTWTSVPSQTWTYTNFLLVLGSCS